MNKLEWHGFQWPAMNTTFTIFSTWTEQELGRGQAVWQQSVIREVERLENCASRFRASSELKRFNQTPISTEIEVSPMLDELLSVSIKMMEHTNGLFNPFMGTQIEQLGYRDSFEKLEQTDIFVDHLIPTKDVAVKKLSINERFWIKLQDINLDFGGIGKGWIVDRLKSTLTELWGVTSGMVDAGGDLVVWGIDDHLDSLCIEIQDPWDEELVIAECHLYNGAIATSNKIHRKWQDSSGNWHHHLIDPRTGRSSTSHIVQATVFAEHAIYADVYAKCLCLLEVDEAYEWLRHVGNVNEAWLIDEQKRQFHWKKDDHL